MTIYNVAPYCDELNLINPRDYLGPFTHFYTITLKPSLYKYLSGTQLDISLSELQKVIGDRRSIVVAEHTQSANIHFHLIVQHTDVNCKIAFCNRAKRKHNRILGFLHIKTDPIDHIDKANRAFNYMFKSLEETMKGVETKTQRPNIVFAHGHLHPELQKSNNHVNHLLFASSLMEVMSIEYENNISPLDHNGKTPMVSQTDEEDEKTC